MKTIERIIPKISPQDDHWFIKKYNKTRYEWFIEEQHRIKGATYNLNFNNKPNLRKTKSQGGSTEMISGNMDAIQIKKHKKYIPPRFDFEYLFSFNYDNMINEEPNKKFNKLLNLKFNHIYYNDTQNLEQFEFIKIYNEMKSDGRLEIINDIYQRLSSYIIKNKLSSKWVDGSIICNISLIISEYLKTGRFNTNFNFLNNIKEYNADKDNRFHLFLILQCFTSHNIYYKQYISNAYIRNWWAICHLRHRYSDKDMKTKGQCCVFKDTNGKNIYKNY